ncbi:glycosyltransferase [Flavivirga amylovorans]|uniref:Glycosyltransferase n=1 Tax=Flavivirga amylovorans TaxID=870486 RepID=A0ABT8X2D4_9FLAO|nr:glycosyltransferase [Flavivirga amylovorans]MDO5987877.1 glycosyltransferase [Flavivirga amylovorans]
MKNILLIMPYGSVGGMERLALSFHNHYKKKGYNVKAIKFIKLQSDIINFGEDELYFKDKDFYQMSKSERFKFYSTAPKLLRKVIKEEKITHSIAFGDMANFFSSLTFTKEFKIASIHALKSVEFSNKSFLNSIFRLSYKTTYYFINKVVCISKDIKQDLISKCGFKFSNKLSVIYNPHDLEEINRLSKLQIDDSKELELFSETENLVLFLGRLSIQKSPWHLIKAFSLVLAEDPNSKLVFIGDGDNEVREHLNKLIDELNISKNVVFLGRKSNPYNYLSKAKLLALSSHYEGTPNVIVESICVETPIVSSFCTKGITELMGFSNITEVNDNIETESGIVTPNLFFGKLGIPTSNQFIEEEIKLSKAIKSVIKSNKYQSVLKKNKDSLLAKFDIDIVTKEYLKS